MPGRKRKRRDSYVPQHLVLENDDGGFIEHVRHVPPVPLHYLRRGQGQPVLEDAQPPAQVRRGQGQPVRPDVSSSINVLSAVNLSTEIEDPVAATDGESEVEIEDDEVQQIQTHDDMTNFYPALFNLNQQIIPESEVEIEDETEEHSNERTTNAGATTRRFTKTGTYPGRPPFEWGAVVPLVRDQDRTDEMNARTSDLTLQTRS